jgi:hypothetical protein
VVETHTYLGGIFPLELMQEYEVISNKGLINRESKEAQENLYRVFNPFTGLGKFCRS